MNKVIDLVQETLDDLLAKDSVRIFWGRRSEIQGEASDAEYVIYDIQYDNAEVSADGNLYYRTMGVSLQYYVKFTTARTYEGRKSALARMQTIMQAMRSVGFGCMSGWVEIGDVDNVGYATFRSVYEIPHEMDEDGD